MTNHCEYQKYCVDFSFKSEKCTNRDYKTEEDRYIQCFNKRIEFDGLLNKVMGVWHDKT